jgi:hypothetical protein
MQFVGPLPAEIDPYIDQNGLVSGERAPRNPSGNGIMFTSEWMLILQFFYPDMVDPWLRFQEIIDKKLTVASGIYRRSPAGQQFASDPARWDDYIALAAASARAGNRKFAQEILEAGRARRFLWGPFRLRYYYPGDGAMTGRDPKAWFGRSPSMIAHLRWAAGETPSWFERLVWSCGVYFAGSSDPIQQDPWRITYLMIQTARPGWLERLAIRKWEARLRQAWPKGIGDVRGYYFRDWSHPNARYAVDVKLESMK